MAVALDDEEQVVQMANVYLRLGGCYQPPVSANIVGLFDPGSVIVQATRLLSRRGDLLEQNGVWVIQVNAADSMSSRRFSALHEGFHVLQRIGAVQLSTPDRAEEERLANLFAASILMPADWVREKLPKLRTLAAMAGVFGVSQTAMAIRLEELGLQPLSAAAGVR